MLPKAMRPAPESESCGGGVGVVTGGVTVPFVVTLPVGTGGLTETRVVGIMVAIGGTVVEVVVSSSSSPSSTGVVGVGVGVGVSVVVTAGVVVVGTVVGAGSVAGGVETVVVMLGMEMVTPACLQMAAPTSAPSVEMLEMVFWV